MNSRLEQEMDWRLRVFDSLSYPTLILSPDRVVIAANDKFLERTRARSEDVVGHSCREVFADYWDDPSPPCKARECPLSQTLETRTGHSMLRCLAEDGGRERWEERVFSPILDDDGSIRYVIESIRDVTRVERLERMFTGMQRLMNRVIQSSASAIVAANRDGNLQLMNEAAEKLFGHNFRGGPALNIRDVYPPGVAKQIMNTLRDEDQGGRGKLPPFRTNIVDSSGNLIPVEMTGAIIYEGDLEVATMGIYNDLREKLVGEKRLREAERQVMQSEKLASLGRLSAGVAHEINNPLTGILLYGSLMEEELDADSPLRENLTCVLEDATRCQEIVRGLLAYSRQATASREDFLLNDLVDHSLGLIRDQKRFMHVEVVKDLTDEAPVVNGDRKQLSQVVINLVINALDAMEHDGTLTLRTYRGSARKLSHLEVADTGCGISVNDRPHIFDPFFTTKEPGKGTGLGLSTSYGIVQENGGELVLLQSSPSGTTFRVSLPTSPESAELTPQSIG